MRIVLYVISILWIGLGTFLIIYTHRTKEFLKKLVYRDNPKWLAIFPFVFGLILVAGAFQRREMFLLAFVLGVLGLAKGIYLFAGPSAQIKALFDWWFHKAGDRTLRMQGLISFILGVAILSYLR